MGLRNNEKEHSPQLGFVFFVNNQQHKIDMSANPFIPYLKPQTFTNLSRIETQR